MKHRPPIALLAAVTAAAALTSTSTASAAEVVLVPASGGVGAEMPDFPQRATQIIQQVAAQHGLRAELTSATREGVLAVAGCTAESDACYEAVLQTLEARTLILVHVTPGSGGAAVDVEIVVASRGAPARKTAIPLMGDNQMALLAELRNKAPRAFGGAATATASGPPGGPPGGTGDTAVPEQNKTIGPDVNPGEGGTFAGRAPAASDPKQPGAGQPPAEAVTPPAEGGDSGGGYDFTRVQNSTWAIAGAGAGVFVIGALFLNAAGNKEDEVRSARANTLADFQRIEDLESTGKTLNTIGNTGVLLGLAGLGVAGYLIYREARVPASEKTPATEVSVVPAIAPGSIGVMATVRR